MTDKSVAEELHKFLKNTNGREIDVVQAMGEENLTPTSHLFKKCGPIKIKNAAESNSAVYTQQAEDCPPLSIIDVVLAANREYNVMVEPVMDYLKQEMNNGSTEITFLKEKTFDSLLEYLINELPKFYKDVVQENKNKGLGKVDLADKRHFILNTLCFKEVNYKKMKTLFDILIAIKELKGKNRLTDFEFMKTWATVTCEEKSFKHKSGAINKSQFQKVLGSKIYNVGIATIQHLRMHFGADTFKPDQRVKEVLLYKFLNLPEDKFSSTDLKDTDAIEMMQKIYKGCNENVPDTKYSMRLLDAIFVNYGSGYYNKNDPASAYTDTIVLEILRKLINRGVNERLVSEVSGYSIDKLSLHPIK
jgi:hypothetical protein